MAARGTSKLVTDASPFASAGEAPLAITRRLDRGLAGLLTLWAVLSLLPLGVSAGIADLAYYTETWRFWLSTLVVAALATSLVLLLSKGAAAAALHAAMARVGRMSRRTFLLGACSAAMVEAAAVSLWCFSRNPQAIDGWVQYFQAKIFLSGRLVAPPPPSISHFATLHMLITERGWFSQFPPLHSALLALGMAAGAPWLVTPVLAGLLPLACYQLGRRSGDERVARLAAILPLLSPFVICMGASAMNHLPAALAVALGLWAAPDVASGRPAAAMMLGLATGLCAGIRPLDATVLALVGGGALVAGLRRGAWRVVPVTLLAGAVALLPTLLFNAVTTGRPLRFAYLELWGPGLELGFHDPPWGQALTPARALGLTAVDAHQLNVYLLEWPLPVTAMIATALWHRRGRLGPGLRAPAAYVVVLITGLFFYFHRDTLYGPRLVFSAVPAVLVLLAFTLVELASVRRAVGWRALRIGDVALVGLVVVGLLSATLLVPKRVAAYRTVGTSEALHPDDDARRAGLTHAVVVMREGWGARLIARMWAAGVPMRDSSRLYRAFNACDLQARLTAAEREGVRGPELVARLRAAMPGADPGLTAPDVVPDRLIRLPSDHRLTPECVAEVERDRSGTMQLGPHLHLNAPTLDGDIVWARDMGDGNEMLRRLYPDRPLYRYALSPDTGRGTFIRLP
jgi:hypothetical protein